MTEDYFEVDAEICQSQNPDVDFDFYFSFSSSFFKGSFTYESQ